MNWIQRLIHQPKELRPRAWIFQAHLWVGVAIGIYAGAIGLSGSALVFRDEIQAAAVERALPPLGSSETAAGPDEAADAMRGAAGRAVGDPLFFRTSEQARTLES